MASELGLSGVNTMIPAACAAGNYAVATPRPQARGGMARDYKAHDRELDELVAIKTLLGLDADDEDAERLLREAQICRKITHPNVVLAERARIPRG